MKISAKAQSYIDQENRYGAHNYHPLPVVLSRGGGSLRLGYGREEIFRFPFCVFRRQSGTLSSENRTGPLRSGPYPVPDLPGVLQRLSGTLRGIHFQIFRI